MNIVKKPEKPRLQPLRGGDWKCHGMNWTVVAGNWLTAYRHWQQLAKDGPPRMQMTCLQLITKA